MKRRAFIAGAVAASALPLAARAQERVRRVGALMNAAAEDPEVQLRLAAFQERLQALGWTEGRNLRIDRRWAIPSDAERTRQLTADLLAQSPDVVIVSGGGVLAVQRMNRTVPIVLTQAIDPVGAGFVTGLARPGGSTTGFMQFEYSLTGKWMQLLKEIAPGITRVGVLRDENTPAGIGQWAALQVAAESAGVELSPLSARQEDGIERGIASFAREPNGGLVVTVSGATVLHRKTIIANIARHRLPAVYPYRFMIAEGGLIAYGVDMIDQYRQVAGYVDRILKGEKPGDLPVQRPTKYQLTINLKTAKALGYTLPPSLVARADEVIE
jgi:putative ABC transport system substrate-binding protein